MSIWSKLIGIKKTEDRNNIIGNKTTSVPCSTHNYAIVDVEIGLKDHKIHDIGALKHDDTTFHKTSKEELFIFLTWTTSADTISFTMTPNTCLQTKYAAGF